jgi:RNA polymerase sigma factor (sigma-70 family)
VLASDDRLVAQIRRGGDAAFEVAFERHGPAILAFCRHMLGSREEAEDAVQHTFAAAYRGLLRDEREIRLKPWLFTIARNRCLSLLRSRREELAHELELPTQGLAEQVERRAELRDLLRDLRELPQEQRAALLLSEVGDLSHADVAAVLGCRVEKVKALVFRARTGLIERREARERPCAEVREQIASLRGGSLRRNELRHHLRHCAGCSEFQDQVKQQRGMLAAALPVVPTLKLKSSVLAAAGLGGGAAGGLATGFGATAANVAVVAVLTGGGAVAGTAIVERAHEPAAPPAAPRAEPGPAGSLPSSAQWPSPAAPAVHGAASPASAPRRAERAGADGAERRGQARSGARRRARGRANSAAPEAQVPAAAPAPAAGNDHGQSSHANGRGVGRGAEEVKPMKPQNGVRAKAPPPGQVRHGPSQKAPKTKAPAAAPEAESPAAEHVPPGQAKKGDAGRQ